MSADEQSPQSLLGNPQLIHPDDVHNQELIRHTHPPDWVNPTPDGRYNLVVIGSGTAGLSAAGGCAVIGGKVALIERYMTGGDCLVTGCVPSKGIISAARVAATVRRQAADYGIRVPQGTQIDFPAVMERMRRLRARISHADAVHDLAESGVDVYLGDARFTGADTVEVGGQTLRFAAAVIATGGRAAEPPIPGLKEIGFLTNETLFELTELPPRLAVIGGGPIGCEMAQTFQRLGSQVTLINRSAHFLPKEDADAADIVQQAFVHDGVQLVLGATVLRVDRDGHDKVVVLEQQGTEQQIRCDAILVGVGRVPNIEAMGLDTAGVTTDAHGVVVNDKLQTSNPKIYAAGDVSSRFKFTHTANVLGRMAMTNALFWGFGGKSSKLVVPWCTYTDPEIAHVGLYEQQARSMGYEVTTFTEPLADNDRAILDGQDDGFVRVHLKGASDTILGATVVAAHAGDLLTYFTLAMSMGKGLSSLASPIYPYPTQAEVIKRLVGRYQLSRVKPWMKAIPRHILKWRR